MDIRKLSFKTSDHVQGTVYMFLHFISTTILRGGSYQSHPTRKRFRIRKTNTKRYSETWSMYWTRCQLKDLSVPPQPSELHRGGKNHLLGYGLSNRKEGFPHCDVADGDSMSYWVF